MDRIFDTVPKQALHSDVATTHTSDNNWTMMAQGEREEELNCMVNFT